MKHLKVLNRAEKLSSNINLLDSVCELHQHQSLEGVVIIGAQHLLESTYLMLKKLKTCGLDPKKTFLLGKCYSTCLDVVDEFRQEGFFVSKDSSVFDSHKSLDDQYEQAMSRFVQRVALELEKIESGKVKKIIALDDGGRLIKEINKYDFGVPVVCIEQTSSGYNYLKDHTINFPIINAARSHAKLYHETPYIVGSAFERLSELIDLSELTDSNILIFGEGVIGQHLAQALQENYNCTIEFCSSKENDPHYVRKLGDANFIFGCSGYKAMCFSDYIHLSEGTKLISLSSSDREFDAHKFRSLFPATDNCLNNFTHQGITLFQSGCPINFWQSRNNIPIQHIQITLSILMSAIFQAQAIDHTKRGFFEIDIEIQATLVTRFVGESTDMLEEGLNESAQF